MRSRVLAEFEARLTPEARAVVRALRDVVLRAAPGVEESRLWGSLSYHRPAVGGRIKGAVCMITAKRGPVRLEFVHGVRLADPHRLLKGEGLSKRFVAVETVAKAASPEITALVRRAAAAVPLTPPLP